MSDTTQAGSNFSSNVLDIQLETPKSSLGCYELPCGYIDADNTLHREIQVREMTGREEDLLASAKLTPLKKINALLAACIERIGTITDRGQIASIVPSMTQGDRVYALLALRMTTLGDEYPVEETCPSCGLKSHYVMSLADLEKKPLADPMMRLQEVPLPSGRVARIRLAIGTDEDKVARVPDEEKPSMLLFCRTETLDGKPPTLNDLRNMSWRDRQALRLAMEDFDGGVDSTLDLTCACGHEFKRDMEMGSQGFFFPGRVQKGLKQKSST